ncbi:MAG: mechanosensitive ion channel [Gammaproteobacteria bacterium]
MQLHVKLAVIIFLVLSFLTKSLFAFEPREANQQLDKITISLSGREMTLNVLTDASTRINDLKREAEKCVKENSDILTELTAQLPDLDPQQLETITKEQLHFLEKKAKTESLISDCKLFILRANESLASFTEQSKQIKKSIILTPREPLGSDLKKYPSLFSVWLQDIHIDKINSILSLNTYSKIEAIFVVGFSLFIVMLSFYVRKRAMSDLKEAKDKKTDGQLLCDRFFKLYFKKSTVIYLFFILFGYASIHDLHYELDFLLNDIFLAFLFYVLVALIVEYLIFPFKQGVSIFKVPKKIGHRILRSVKVYMGVCLIGLIGYNFTELFTDDTFYALSLAIYFTILSISFLFVLYNTLLVSTYIEQHAKLRSYLLFVLSLAFFVLIYLRWYGFEGLSSYILKGVMLTYVGAIISYLLFKLMNWLIDCFSGTARFSNIRIFKIFNFQKDDVLLEMIIMKLVVFFIIWGGFAVLINEFWSLSELWSIKVREVVVNGFNIANAHIIPLRIVGGLVFFSSLVLGIKILKHSFYAKDHISFNAVQEAYVIILGYFGYGTILVFALLIAGVNLQGLAIIAGALSVGIGFGLQGIVNNFVSGLVLLLERPIKRGDRIIVGDKEGFVADIGIRSTRINTMNQTDVMIPNAELISSNVVNYMYNNKKTRVTVFTEVEHGTDPVLVKTLLFTAAREHPAIIQTGSDEPAVYMSGFTNYSLKFELWCSVENVNFLYQTKSELYQRINHLFSENNIKLAFQQVDLHLKDTPPIDVRLQKPDETDTTTQR